MANPSTFMPSDDEARATRMLIATFQRDQATVVEVKVDMNALIKWIGSPDEASSFFGQARSVSDENK